MTPQQLVSAIPAPCAHVTHDGIVGAISPALEALFGAAILGRHYITAFRQPALIDRIEAALTENRAETGEYKGRDHGRDTSYQVTATPVAQAGGAGVLLFFEDVTPVEEAGERRSEFVANVSHELRTPLTAISGFIETLRGPARDDSEARDRFLEIMERETRRMNRLVDDLLSLSRVEDVERMRPTGPVDVCALVAGAAAGLGPLADDRNVRLTIVGCDTPTFAPGDPDQLAQVFTNLIDNAIKYGRENGHVTVTVQAVQDASGLRGPGIRITVADEGEGVDARHLGRLTERFYRADTHRSRQMGGTGLGLAIVKHIINRHGGRLKVESTLGRGTTFTILLPVE